MRIIPVIDVMDGVVVRAVGGRRSEYRPIQSRLTTSTDPVEVARAMIDHTGADTLYVADLDGIVKGKANHKIVRELRDDLHVEILLDVGVRTQLDLEPIYDLPRLTIVLSTESLHEPVEIFLAEMWSDQLAFSIDSRAGRLLLGNLYEWVAEGLKNDRDVCDFIETVLKFAAVDMKFILLELESIGEKRGPSTSEWCRQIRDRWPDIELFTGGGVRDWDDVRRLEAAGADGVLVASAIHDGTLTFPRPLL